MPEVIPTPRQGNWNRVIVPVVTTTKVKTLGTFNPATVKLKSSGTFVAGSLLDVL